jgi:hypothetical protein
MPRIIAISGDAKRFAARKKSYRECILFLILLRYRVLKEASKGEMHPGKTLGMHTPRFFCSSVKGCNFWSYVPTTRVDARWRSLELLRHNFSERRIIRHARAAPVRQMPGTTLNWPRGVASPNPIIIPSPTL